VVVEREPLAHVADAPLHFLRAGNDIHAGYGRFAGRGGKEPCQHADGGRLSCSVGSQEAEHLAATYGERDVVHRGEPSKAPRQVPDLDRVHAAAPAGSPIRAMKVSSIPGSILAISTS